MSLCRSACTHNHHRVLRHGRHPRTCLLICCWCERRRADRSASKLDCACVSQGRVTDRGPPSQKTLQQPAGHTNGSSTAGSNDTHPKLSIYTTSAIMAALKRLDCVPSSLERPHTALPWMPLLEADTGSVCDSSLVSLLAAAAASNTDVLPLSLCTLVETTGGVAQTRRDLLRVKVLGGSPSAIRGRRLRNAYNAFKDSSSFDQLQPWLVVCVSLSACEGGFQSCTSTATASDPQQAVDPSPSCCTTSLCCSQFVSS